MKTCVGQREWYLRGESVIQMGLSEQMGWTAFSGWDSQTRRLALQCIDLVCSGTNREEPP